MKQGISFETNGDEKDIPTYFGKKKKNIDENAACLYVATCAYLNNTNNPKKTSQFEKYLNRIQDIVAENHKIFSTQEHLIQLSKNAYFNKTLVKLIGTGVSLSFEHKKTTINIVHDIFKIMDGETQHCAKYFELNTNFIDVAKLLIENCGLEDMNFFSGNILRAFAKHYNLLKILLDFNFLDKLIKLVEDQRFEISSEAFEIFHNILIHKREKEKLVVFQFVKSNFDKFVDFYTGLLNYDNYLCQRSCLKALYELLSDPINDEIMIKYISLVDNLKTIINFLSNGNKGIQYEGFMLLELLVKNINRSTNPDINHIITNNKSRLIQFVNELDVESEQEYKLNKDLMLSQLESLV